MSHEDFTIDSLATYLQLAPAEVQRMAERGRVPGRRLGGQWRFSHAEIHHWMEDRIGASNSRELSQMTVILNRQSNATTPDSIVQQLPLEAIEIPLTARTRASVIDAMVEVALRSGLLWDGPKLRDAIQARENLHPTALDSGAALLHPRRPLGQILAEPFLALGCTPRGIPFGGSSQLTDVFFVICSADDRGHLRTLARLSRLIAASGFLDAIRLAQDARQAWQAVEIFEAELVSA